MPHPDDVPSAPQGPGDLNPGRVRDTTWRFEKDVPWDPDHPEQMRQWLEDLANQIVSDEDRVEVELVDADGAAVAAGGPDKVYRFVVCSGKRLMYPDADPDDVGGVTDNDADDAAPAPPDA